MRGQEHNHASSQADAAAISGFGSVAASRFLEQASVACTPDHSSRLSVIVPCYNEAATAAELLRRIRQALPHAQLIVVDDGSNDGSLEEIISSQQQFGLHVQSLGCNSGKGTAFRAGLELADRDYVVIQDADLEYDPATGYKLFPRELLVSAPPGKPKMALLL